jgi:hypothetical protein
MKNKDKGQLLSSWKEIAAYLDCQERTCQRWEKKLGLPVHRIDESSRSHVYAYKDEIDIWLTQKLNQKSTTQNGLSLKTERKKILFILGPILLISLIVFSIKPFKDRRPSDFRIEGSSLVLVNKKGNKLWTFDTKLENLKIGNLFFSLLQILHNFPHFSPTDTLE